MSAFVLKLIAIISMVIDHTAHIFRSEISGVSPWLYVAMRAIGRLAFPLFAFGMAEGAAKTGSGKKYLGRMLLFAFISQIPFSLMVGLTSPDLTVTLFGRSFGVSTELSVMVTLFLGLALCLALKENRPYLAVAAIAAAYLADRTLGMDYGFMGAAFVFALYIMRTKKLRLLIVMLFFACVFQTGAVTSAAKLVLGIESGGLSTLLVPSVNLLATAFAAVPVMFYNGKRGPKTGIWAYLVYPVHMAALLAVKYLFF